MTPDYCRNLCLIRLISCNRGVGVLSRRLRAQAPAWRRVEEQTRRKSCRLLLSAKFS